MSSNDSKWLTPEWMQLGLEALAETVGASPDLKRQMIEFLLESGLWDSQKTTYESALNRFNACLNPAQPETFKTAHIWALMKRFDRHGFFLAMARDLGYEVRKIPTDERRAQLEERLAIALERAAEAVNTARDEIARMDQPGASVRPHPIFRTSGGNFSLDESTPRSGEPGGF